MAASSTGSNPIPLGTLAARGVGPAWLSSLLRGARGQEARDAVVSLLGERIGE
ncbi:hypothetical protein GCM10023160_11880 [Brachybacterium paraconglomeratum]|uniref:hypothetical protein n=1 Tax=Brachybacterium paraconglomeratum TaxID=173362 RepID=UPI0031E5EE44